MSDAGAAQLWVGGNAFDDPPNPPPPQPPSPPLLNTTVSSGQTLSITSGQTSSGLVLVGGSVTVQSSGTTVGTIISSGGSETIDLFGLASASLVSSGGRQIIDEGTAKSTIVNGGIEIVGAGGSLSATTVLNGGSEFISNGGFARFDVISSGGIETVGAGGEVVSTTVLNEGRQVLSNSALAEFTVVSSGGTLVVSSTGNVVDMTVDNSGFADVLSGGSATGSATISGGTLEVAGHVSTVIFSGSGGTLRLDGTTPVSPSYISGFSAGNMIDFAGVSYASGGSTYMSGDGVLVVSAAGSAYRFQLDPHQDFSEESFQVEADGSGGTLISAYVAISAGQAFIAQAHHGRAPSAVRPVEHRMIRHGVRVHGFDFRAAHHVGELARKLHRILVGQVGIAFEAQANVELGDQITHARREGPDDLIEVINAFGAHAA